MKTKNALSLILILISLTCVAQYNPSATNGTSIASGQSGVALVNCDVRNYLTIPVNAIVWDGTSPSLYWEWNGYFGTINLPSTAVSPDVAVIYDNTIVSEPYILVVYTEYTSSTVTNIAFRVYKYISGSHTFAIQSGDSHDYSCSSNDYTRVNIDAESRGFFVFTWESGLDLHTVAGKLTASGSHINIGTELTLTLPTGTNCNNDITKPDVAIFSQNTTTTLAYVYYTYIRCQGNQPAICEQTYNFNDVRTGTSAPTILSSYVGPTVQGQDYNYWGYPRIAANQYFTTGQVTDAVANEFTIVCSSDHWADQSAIWIGSIFAITSIYDGTSITYSRYNLCTSEYLSKAPITSTFYNFNSGTPYSTVENSHFITCNFPNENPAVTYDKNNGNIVIVWDMNYGEGVYSSFPYSPFPCQMYANPVYDGTSGVNNSNNSVVMGAPNCIQYRSLDNTAAQSTSNTDFIVATNSHNTQDIVYAWHMGGTIRTKVLSSGATPRLSGGDGAEGQLTCFPNPVFISNSSSINLNLVSGQTYSFKIYNESGQTVCSLIGDKYLIEGKAIQMIKQGGAGIYNLQIGDQANHYSNCRIIGLK